VVDYFDPLENPDKGFRVADIAFYPFAVHTLDGPAVHMDHAADGASFFSQGSDKIGSDMPGSARNENRHLKPIIA
jgi:hypothetical protein